jgi:hypothetical protein
MATFLTKKHLSRRTFIRGGSVALGLPFLDAMVPAGTAWAQTAAKLKTRAGFFYLPHGAIMNNTVYGKEVDTWSSTGKGADYKLGATLSPLEPYKRYVTTFDNIENVVAQGSVHTLNQLGAKAKLARLEDYGLLGNGHFMNEELNNGEIAKKVFIPFLSSIK